MFDMTDLTQTDVTVTTGFTPAQTDNRQDIAFYITPTASTQKLSDKHVT